MASNAWYQNRPAAHLRTFVRIGNQANAVHDPRKINPLWGPSCTSFLSQVCCVIIEQCYKVAQDEAETQEGNLVKSKTIGLSNMRPSYEHEGYLTVFGATVFGHIFTNSFQNGLRT
jgi:hypothetical protein